ncbi:hypothetical protein CC1G_01517 [Coprinopsis cinerea okayama7|uniref:SnoaL-like domain-containing protein n=1 Tax=Coprinopsis cinerea (strain Okayama-7 / 130 / ATCC MYA-4618 / FGSC 9003) TaxID=240176 RepID=A8NHW0_COPC7|nr:hypothetical protein CC1G_01517 [Coprinopsis cinerea okayama7\|eukprot:XP_001833840.1 hypothetical protein CC1G_01517 [Coprinopsis cinerea okayama7\
MFSLSRPIFFTTLLTLLSFLFLSTQALVLGNQPQADTFTKRGPPGPGPWPPTVCNPTDAGPGLQARQQAALADFAYLFFDLHDVQTAFDRWVPGQYINHNPFATQGRTDAIDILTDLFADGTVTTDVQRIFAGQGYGAVHQRMEFPGVVTFSVIDYFRFEGTCIVEHWDVAQEVTGTETNPIAFF